MSSLPQALMMPDTEYLSFVAEFEKISGMSLNLYKEKQMKRRINTYIERQKSAGYGEFLNLLRTNPSVLDDFKDYITINVTEFFRTPDHWKEFVDIVIEEFKDKGGEEIRIWSCACSIGEEPYSLAMSLLNHLENPHFHILATDIDERVLERARKGIYSRDAVESIPQTYLERFFRTDGETYTIKDEVKNYVDFKTIDLLKDDYPDGMDLIVCRNVLIYFTDEAKDMIYKNILKSLKAGGYLFTGNTEQLIYYKKYGYKKVTKFLYKKPEKIQDGGEKF